MKDSAKLEIAQNKINKILKDLYRDGVQARVVVDWYRHNGEYKTFGVLYPQVKLTLITMD